MPKKEQQCMESCKKPSKVLTGGDKRANLKLSGVVIQKMGHFLSGSWKQSLDTEDKEMRMGEKGMRELKKRNEIQIDDERLANFPLFFVFLFEIFKLKLNNPFNP